MAFQSVPNTVEVALRMHCDGELLVNTLCFSSEAGWDATSMENLAADVTGWWADNIKPIACPALTLDEVYVLDLENESGPSVLWTTGLPIDGDSASNPLPLNVTATVTFRTAQRGRSYRGRNYFPAFPDTAQESVNQMTAAFHDGFLEAYENIPTEILFNSAQHVVVSRWHNLVKRAVGVATPVTSYSVNTDLDSMRRRLAGRGA